ncbi:MAG: glycine--tRNA ligase subunit beta [Vicinamibacteria bacterium]
MKTAPFLWEIGCEEYPANWLPRTIDELRERFHHELEQHGFGEAEVRAYGTLRRLVVHVPKLPEKQADRCEEVTGPPAAIARAANGEWTKAALGFARKNELAPRELTVLQTPKGEYVGFVRKVKGRRTLELLPAMMASTLRKLSFPKFMNWDAELDDGGGNLPFGRPIRWMVCLLGSKVVPFEIRVAGKVKVRAGNKTRGHRFLAPKGKKPNRPFTVRTFRDLERGLEKHFVLLDPEDRAALLEREIRRLEKKAGAKRISDLGELTNRILADLVEWPGAVLGNYPKEFTALPEEVRHTVLIHHQKYIPLRGKPSFVAVTNMPSDRKGYIRQGSERVVIARLRDAQFFWAEDLKQPLEERLGRLAGALFHAKLGTYRDKVDRIIPLTGWLAAETGQSVPLAERAALLAKCDLATDMVGEFPELQGVMGSLYAREQGEPEEIARAIASQYLPTTLEGDGDFPANPLGATLSLADKLDTLAGMFAVGVVPTGSRDPFALRRQAIGAIRILLEAKERTGLELQATTEELLDKAFEQVERQLGSSVDAGARDALGEFLKERLRFVFGRDFRFDEINAVFAVGVLDRPLEELRRRLAAVAALRGSDDFEALSVAFKRVRNILLSETVPSRVDPGAFVEQAEKDLWGSFEAIEPSASEFIAQGRFGEALRALSRLRPRVDTFFDRVLVMAPDQRLKENRLALLALLQALFTRVADLSEIVAGSEAASS